MTDFGGSLTSLAPLLRKLEGVKAGQLALAWDHPSNPMMLIFGIDSYLYVHKQV